MLLDPREHFVRDQRRRAIGPHAAGVGTGVAVVGPLVVLRGWQGDDRLPIGDRQHAGLFAIQALFDDDLISGLAEFAFPGDAVHGLERLGPARAHDHAFAGRQPVGLDHHGHVLAVLQKSDRAFGIAKHAVVARGDVGMSQQVLAEDLAPFELGCRLAGAENAQFLGLERVDNAERERLFGPDDREADIVLLGELDEARKIGRADVDVLGHARRARVARRDEDAVDVRTLPKLPGQRMLAPATTDHQELHSRCTRMKTTKRRCTCACAIGGDSSASTKCTQAAGSAAKSRAERVPTTRGWHFYVRRRCDGSRHSLPPA